MNTIKLNQATYEIHRVFTGSQSKVEVIGACLAKSKNCLMVPLTVTQTVGYNSSGESAVKKEGNTGRKISRIFKTVSCILMFLRSRSAHQIYIGLQKITNHIF